MEQADAGQPYQTFSVIKNFFLFKARGEHFVPCIVGATVAINRSSMPAAVTVELKNIPQTALKLRDRPTSLSNLVVRASARYLGKGVYRLDIPPYSSAIWAHP
jgi:hypothetical protein